MRAPLPPVLVRFLVLAPPIAWCAVLWWISSQPQPPVDPQMNDKMAHGLAYGLLGALWVRAFWFTTDYPAWRVFLTGLGLAAGYGVVDELHQSFVPGRDASVGDGVADFAGALLGAGLAQGMYLLTLRLGRGRSFAPSRDP